MQTPSAVDTVLVRMDRIGDLVLSVPVDELAVFSGQKTHWFITSGLGFVLDAATPARSYTEFNKKFSWKQLMHMVGVLRQLGPQRVIVFHAPWWVGLATFLAGIHERVGRLSQWHSFIFFNHGVRQSRKKADRHEMDYNIDLLRRGLDNESVAAPSSLYLKLSVPEAASVLEPHKLKKREYAVVHPGMGGSALNWPANHYVEFIKKMATQVPIVITGTPFDQKFLKPLRPPLQNAPNIIWLDGQLKGRELIAVLSGARWVVAPSTGVIHLAASCGTAVIGLYSYVPVEKALRWGPRGPRVVVLEPKLRDMASITVNSVLEAVQGL